ncbi:MAG: hypothetical protein HC781_18800 [Leptolyngbyaceae cyanobacterium CSU_1_4]|nr:hypothetical protein [Leptolyngbyaceae cyanobacterium CSU_1_4]
MSGFRSAAEGDPCSRLPAIARGYLEAIVQLNCNYHRRPTNSQRLFEFT